MAQVDHLDEVVEAGVAVGAALDEPDAGVDAFDAGVGQPVGDRRDDAVEVVADAPGQGYEGVDVGAGGGVAPLVEVPGGSLVAEPLVEAAEVLLELPGPVELLLLDA
jgi:hypothetical protein